ncbi:hypothetical protein [Halalkalibacter flavus]|uniref:hypothetical protein n=1 Tax=Halalkalibacter flavus TaxID=3090668 RepID=UPI002FC5E043
MVSKITFNAQCFDGYRSVVLEELPILRMEEKEISKLDQCIGFIKKHKKEIYRTMVYALAVLTMPYTMGMSGGMNIIILLQKASFWVGLGITIWGIVEMQLDFPGWRGRILKGVLGYIGILLIPLVFIELQNSLQVDVWEQINNSNMGTPVSGE